MSRGCHLLVDPVYEALASASWSVLVLISSAAFTRARSFASGSALSSALRRNLSMLASILASPMASSLASGVCRFGSMLVEVDVGECW
jgi:hypothetical protein